MSPVDSDSISGPAHLRSKMPVLNMLESSNGSSLAAEEISLMDAAVLERRSIKTPGQEVPAGLTGHWLIQSC